MCFILLWLLLLVVCGVVVSVCCIKVREECKNQKYCDSCEQELSLLDIQFNLICVLIHKVFVVPGLKKRELIHVLKSVA